MLDSEIMQKKPKDGHKFIYRYWDDGGSYIGQTKKSLKQRAGKNGKLYLTNVNKWSNAIKEKGFDSFNVEILCECLETDADKEEKKYIKQFNSRNNGYNSTPGGTWYNPDWDYDDEDEFDIVYVDLNKYYSKMSDEDIYFSCKLAEKLLNISTTPNTVYNIELLDSYYKKLYKKDIDCEFYAFEGDFYYTYCNMLLWLDEYIYGLCVGKRWWSDFYRYQICEQLYSEYRTELHKKYGFDPIDVMDRKSDSWREYCREIDNVNALVEEERSKEIDLDLLNTFVANSNYESVMDYVASAIAPSHNVADGNEISLGYTVKYRFLHKNS